VKLEGGVRTAAAVSAITLADIPVVGHIGLTPQSVRRLGGYKVQRDEGRLLDDALALEAAGVFAVVVECVPSEVAQRITAALKIPTIGIGAGPHCDGQVLVIHDALGLLDGFQPKFARRYADLGDQVRAAVASYIQDVAEGRFPGLDESFR
jgi:3-methyl-2-oxobutanoate hydroxymethyltransferase